MARRGRPPKSPRAAESGGASDAPTPVNTTAPEAKAEASNNPPVRKRRVIAVTNIRCNAGEFRPKDVLPDNVQGLDRLIEVGAAKVVK